MIFNSSVSVAGTFNSDFSVQEIKDEPMLFNCDLNFAKKHGGPITKAFIEALPEDWKNCDVVIDSKSHMLMPGWYTCIPGWHHDDVPRNTANGQPNYTNPAYASQHILGLVNSHVSATEFAIGSVDLEIIDNDVYKIWNQKVESAVQSGDMTVVSAESGKLYSFDCDTFHRGVKASCNGWRFFIRVSRNTDRTKTVTNEIRNQVQVYLEFPMQGW